MKSALAQTPNNRYRTHYITCLLRYFVFRKASAIVRRASTADPFNAPSGLVCFRHSLTIRDVRSLAAIVGGADVARTFCFGSE
jgi:hypothetical protein